MGICYVKGEFPSWRWEMRNERKPTLLRSNARIHRAWAIKCQVQRDCAALLWSVRALEQDPPYDKSAAMRKHRTTFVSLDGVMQAPGGPEEDPTGGLPLALDVRLRARQHGLLNIRFRRQGSWLVLGRRTYQIFEAYWPYQPDDHPIAKTLNAAKKYVASRTLTMLHWNNSTLLRGDVARRSSLSRPNRAPTCR